MNVQIFFAFFFAVVILSGFAYAFKIFLWFATDMKIGFKPIVAFKVPDWMSSEQKMNLKVAWNRSDLAKDYHLIAYPEGSEVKVFNAEDVIEKELKYIFDENKEANNGSR
jgi:hypothetical protein